MNKDAVLRAIVFFIAKVTSYPVFFLLFRCRIIKKEKYKAADINNSIIYANHMSYLDPLLLIYAFHSNKLKFVMNQTVNEKNRFLKWILTTVGCISINKMNFSLANLSEMVEVFKQNKTLVIFPEGQIQESSEKIAEFRDGMALISSIQGVPIRPVYLHKPKSIFERHKIIIGKAIMPEKFSGMPKKEDIKRFNTVARDALAALSNSKEI